MRRLSRNLGRDTQGNAIIEAALGLPIMLTMLIGILELAHYYFVAASIENAVLRASRFGITGAQDAGSTRADQVRAIIAANTFGQVDMNSVQIDTLVYEQFADIGKPEPYTDQNGSGSYDAGEPFSDVNGNGMWDADMAVAGLGGAGDIVLYRISYDAQSLTGAFDWALSSINLTSAVAVRNEPY